MACSITSTHCGHTAGVNRALTYNKAALTPLWAGACWHAVTALLVLAGLRGQAQGCLLQVDVHLRLCLEGEAQLHQGAVAHGDRHEFEDCHVVQECSWKWVDRALGAYRSPAPAPARSISFRRPFQVCLCQGRNRQMQGMLVRYAIASRLYRDDLRGPCGAEGSTT